MRHTLTILIMTASLQLAACGDATDHSAVADAHSKPVASLELTNAKEVNLQDWTFYTADEHGFAIEVDLHSAKDCFPSLSYTVNPVGENRYLVIVEHQAVPAVICSPDREREIQYGAIIDVPAIEGGRLVTVLVHDLTGRDIDLKAPKGVETDVGGGQAYDLYTYIEHNGVPFRIQAGRRTVNDCFKTLNHTAHALKSGFFVDVESLAVPAVVCTPGMSRDIELGVDIDVKPTHGFSYGQLYVGREWGQPVEVATAR